MFILARLAPYPDTTGLFPPWKIVSLMCFQGIFSQIFEYLVAGRRVRLRSLVLKEELMTKYMPKLLICFLLISILTATYMGCRKKSGDDDANHHQTNQSQPFPPGPSRVSLLKVVLRGPFVVIVRRDHDNRLLAYIPFDDMHEFYFPSPDTAQTAESFHFDLSESGLETPSRPAPYVDHGFDDFNPDLKNFKPDPKNYYVMMDLPAPDIVSFMPPPEGVLFNTNPRTFGRIPTTHVIEYRVRDASKIIMHSKELGELRPEPCGEDSYSTKDDDTPEREPAVCYVLTVKLSHHVNDLNKHAIDFFNEKILPSMFG